MPVSGGSVVLCSVLVSNVLEEEDGEEEKEEEEDEDYDKEKEKRTLIVPMVGTFFAYLQQ